MMTIIMMMLIVPLMAVIEVGRLVWSLGAGNDGGYASIELGTLISYVSLFHFWP